MPIILQDSTANALRVVSPPTNNNNRRPNSHQQLRRPLLQAAPSPQPLEPIQQGKSTSSSKQEQHLVLVGGGHAHAQVIKALNWASRPSQLKVTLIDVQSSAWYSGMVPGCIAQRYEPDETLLHLKPLAEWAGIDFIHDKVVDIDLENKLVHLAGNNNDNNDASSSNAISFDCISIDIGSTSRGLDDTPGAREYTIPTRPISKLVERIDRSLDQYLPSKEKEDDQQDEQQDPRVVVIGGGAAGVELSMSLNGRFRSQLPHKKTQVTLLDTGTELLPGESKRGREALQQILREKGIQVVHECQVEELYEDHVFASITGESSENERQPITIPFTHCIWATGAGAHPLAHRLQQKGLDATKHGWIRVNEYLQSTSHPFVFAAGDCCHIENLPNGSPPKAGVFAVRAGPVLIENLTAYLQKLRQEANQEQSNMGDDSTMDKCDLKAYVPQEDFLKLLVCGDGRALGLRFGHAFHGTWVMQLKDKIDTNFMDLFRKDNLPELTPGGGYDTSQYDAKMAAKTDLDPQAGAQLLSRTDDDVNYQQAWGVIRSMADDEDYRDKVLSIMEENEAQSSPVAA